MSCSHNNWSIRPVKQIPYGHQPRNFKQKIRKIFNTILAFLAYRCPINSLRIKLHRWRGVNIGKNVYIGQYCILDNLAPEYIYIEDNVNINAGTMILTHFNPAPRFKSIFASEIKPVIIREQAMIAVRCTIFPGVEIGNFAFVSAGAIVDHDVPAYHLLETHVSTKYINLEKILNHSQK